MTYKDIVLKLLHTRENIICLEDHLLSDFLDIGNPIESFSQWCQEHDLVFSRVSAEPTKICLQKKIYILENNAIE